MRPGAKRLWRATLALGGGFAVYVSVLAAFQKSLIYFPTRAPEAILEAEAHRIGLEPWRDNMGSLTGWQTPASATPAKRLLVFHGNGGYALHRIYLAALPPPDWQVLLFEYPGYGSRPGSPSEAAIRSAALAALDSLTGPGAPPLYLAGESLGSGVASWLASQRPQSVSGMVLITPMTRLADVGARHYPFLPVHLFLTERYDSVAALRSYQGPVAFVTAGQDEIVPVDLGRELHRGYSGPKRLWEQPEAGHNTLHFGRTWWAPVFQFLAASAPGT